MGLSCLSRVGNDVRTFFQKNFNFTLGLAKKESNLEKEIFTHSRFLKQETFQEIILLIVFNNLSIFQPNNTVYIFFIFWLMCYYENGLF